MTIAMMKTPPMLPAIAAIAPEERPSPLPLFCDVDVDVDCGNLVEGSGARLVVVTEIEMEVNEVIEVGEEFG